jgi:hypothetical protein
MKILLHQAFEDGPETEGSETSAKLYLTPAETPKENTQTNKNENTV